MDNQKKLQKLFGQLNYPCTMSRPDLCFALNKIARRLQNPSIEVSRAAKREGR